MTAKKRVPIHQVEQADLFYHIPVPAGQFCVARELATRRNYFLYIKICLV